MEVGVLKEIIRAEIIEVWNQLHELTHPQGRFGGWGNLFRRLFQQV